MPELTITKRCSKCKTFKPCSDFCKSKSRPDGYRCQCKVCMETVRKRYRDSAKGKAVEKAYQIGPVHKAYRKAYTASENGKAVKKAYAASPRGKVGKQRSEAKYRERFPNKVKAHNAVNNAVIAGELPRPDSLICTCKEPAKEYHHYLGYAPKHWFDVVPRCVACHTKLHRCVV